MMDLTTIELQGEQLQLHASRALLWPRRRTVFVADVHLGKEHAFGRHGVPIPRGPSEHSLQRLGELVVHTGAERLMILGDLMHAAPTAAESWLASLSDFLDQHRSLAVQVCAGNHDPEAGQAAIDARIRWHNSALVDGPFVLQHHPGDDPRGYVLCGHVHPVIRLGRGRRNTMRLPVFWLRPGHGVLPAFGSFTGGQLIQAETGDRLWICGPERVLAYKDPVRPGRCADVDGAVSSDR